MFEGKPLTPAELQGDSLRPLAWSELSSRLAAARDLRASLAPGEGDGEGSFDALSARWIAAHMDGQQDVNPEDSSNGKTAGSTGPDAPPVNRGGAMREE